MFQAEHKDSDNTDKTLKLLFQFLFRDAATVNLCKFKNRHSQKDQKLVSILIIT